MSDLLIFVFAPPCVAGPTATVTHNIRIHFADAVSEPFMLRAANSMNYLKHSGRTVCVAVVCLGRFTVVMMIQDDENDPSVGGHVLCTA